MFDPTSRYAHLSVMQYRSAGAAEEETIAYVSRRFIPPVETLQPISTVVVRAADRVDHLAATAYGDPTQFWRLADGNRVRSDSELLEPVGKRLMIPAVTPPPESETAPS